MLTLSFQLNPTSQWEGYILTIQCFQYLSCFCSHCDSISSCKLGGLSQWAKRTRPCLRKFFIFFRLPRKSLSVAVAAWNCKKAWTRVTFQVGWGFVNRLNPGMLPLHCQHPRTPHCGFTFLKYTPKLHRRVYCRTDLFTLHLQCILHLTITCAFRPSTRHADTDRLLMSGVNVITKQDYPCVV